MPTEHLDRKINLKFLWLFIQCIYLRDIRYLIFLCTYLPNFLKYFLFIRKSLIIMVDWYPDFQTKKYIGILAQRLNWAKKRIFGGSSLPSKLFSIQIIFFFSCSIAWLSGWYVSPVLLDTLHRDRPGSVQILKFSPKAHLLCGTLLVECMQKHNNQIFIFLQQFLQWLYKTDPLCDCGLVPRSDN